jgi:hypothetical protein
VVKRGSLYPFTDTGRIPCLATLYRFITIGEFDRTRDLLSNILASFNIKELGGPKVVVF